MGELPPLDHSAIEYDDFAKDFYDEAPDVFALDDAEVRWGSCGTAAPAPAARPTQPPKPANLTQDTQTRTPPARPPLARHEALTHPAD